MNKNVSHTKDQGKIESSDMPFHVMRSAPLPGPKVAIFGAIHGNEICGSRAIEALIDDIDSGRVQLQKGALVLVPFCNPLAAQKGVRFIEENLNRVFYPTSHPKTYEARLANHLTNLLKDCDILLDLHSFHTKGDPFTLLFDEDEDEKNLIEKIKIPVVITGWVKAYQNAGLTDKISSNGHTHFFMRSIGKKAVGVECGWHQDPQSIVIARQVIDRLLDHLGIIAPLESREDERPKSQKKTFDLFYVYVRESEKDCLAQDFGHGDFVRQGAVLAYRADGTAILAKEDAFIMFPYPDSLVGDEWFYLARKVDGLDFPDFSVKQAL